MVGSSGLSIIVVIKYNKIGLVQNTTCIVLSKLINNNSDYVNILVPFNNVLRCFVIDIEMRQGGQLQGSGVELWSFLHALWTTIVKCRSKVGMASQKKLKNKLMVKILAKEPKNYSRKILEAIHICQNNPSLNRDKGWSWTLSGTGFSLKKRIQIQHLETLSANWSQHPSRWYLPKDLLQFGG